MTLGFGDETVKPNEGECTECKECGGRKKGRNETKRRRDKREGVVKDVVNWQAKLPKVYLTLVWKARPYLQDMPLIMWSLRLFEAAAHGPTVGQVYCLHITSEFSVCPQVRQSCFTVTAMTLSSLIVLNPLSTTKLPLEYDGKTLKPGGTTSWL